MRIIYERVPDDNLNLLVAGAEFDAIYPPYQGQPWRRVRFRVEHQWDNKQQKNLPVYVPVGEWSLKSYEIEKYQRILDAD